MTTLDDLFIKTPKPNGITSCSEAQYMNSTTWPADRVTVIGTGNPQGNHKQTIVTDQQSDKEFYKKMHSIDSAAAKQFMESRLKGLKEKVTALREEIKQIEEYMEPSEDKIMSTYYKKVRNSDNPGSLKSHIVNYFKDNLKKDIKADTLLEFFKSKGLKLWSKASIGQVLYKMVKMKEITNPYRGYFRMEA